MENGEQVVSAGATGHKRPVLQTMPTIQVTSPLSENDENVWDADSDSEKGDVQICEDLSNVNHSAYSQHSTNATGKSHTPVERTVSAIDDAVVDPGKTIQGSRSWHGDLNDEVFVDRGRPPSPENEESTECQSNHRRPSVVLSPATTPVYATDDEMSDVESQVLQQGRKSSMLSVPRKRSRKRRESETNERREFHFFNHKPPDQELMAIAAKFVAEVLLMAQKEALQSLPDKTEPIVEVKQEVHTHDDGKVHLIRRRARRMLLRFLATCGCLNNLTPSP